MKGRQRAGGRNPRSILSRIARFDTLTLRWHTQYSSSTIIANHLPHVTHPNVAFLRYSSMRSVLFFLFAFLRTPRGLRRLRSAERKSREGPSGKRRRFSRAEVAPPLRCRTFGDRRPCMRHVYVKVRAIDFVLS